MDVTKSKVSATWDYGPWSTTVPYFALSGFYDSYFINIVHFSFLMVDRRDFVLALIKRLERNFIDLL